MLYLSEETLGEDITGICFTESDYNGSPLRKYFNLAFANNISAASALQPIERPDADGRNDYAALLSTDEYEAYAEMIEAGMPAFFGLCQEALFTPWIRREVCALFRQRKAGRMVSARSYC